MQKLSEAVREGSLKTGKLEGGFATRGGDGRLDACALGAAYVELTGDEDGAEDGDNVTKFIEKTYPLIKDPNCVIHKAEEEATCARVADKWGIEIPKEVFKVTRELNEEVKGCRCKTREDIMQEIMQRNDNGESRESIADWLESIGL